MALTAPTPPTPPAPFSRPTPPIPPKVTLDGGGSVTETTEPQSHGPQTDEELHEQQAREAVVHGSGALSKTTVKEGEKGEKGTQPVQERQELPAKQNREKAAVQLPPSGSVRQSGISQDNTSQLFPEDSVGQRTQTQQKAPPEIPDSPNYHGMLYWGITLLVISVLVVIILRTVMFRKRDEKEASGNLAAGREEQELRPKIGMTAGEVLQEIERKEERRRVAPPAQAAREYAMQAAAKPAPRPERSSRKKSAPPPEPKPGPPPQRTRDGEGRDRFEVRV